MRDRLNNLILTRLYLQIPYFQISSHIFGRDTVQTLTNIIAYNLSVFLNLLPSSVSFQLTE
jgi:hypothetical protein